MTTAFFLLFSWGMVRARTRRQVIALALAGTTAAALVARPSRVYAQDIAGAIQAVLDAINGVIQTALNGINTVRSAISNFYQTVTWPVQLINQAQQLVTQMIGQYRSLMRSILNINLVSATLPAAQALERVVRDQQAGDFGAVNTNYGAVFGPLPASTAASPQDRMMIDMDDALAQDNLKTLKETDNDQIEDAASQAAPGSAPFLTATAVAASIQSQALTQKMIAAELRQEAARVAHSNALKKRGAAYASHFSGSIQNMLQPK